MSDVFWAAVIMVLCISALVGCSIWWGVESCEAKSISSSRHKYSVVSGCMVYHKGRWLPLENIRGFD